MNETRKRLIIDLLERYKENFFETPLSKDGADELYKWELITKCHEKTEVEIIRNFESKNIVHVQTVYPVLTELLKNNQQQLVVCFNGLKDENRSLSDRLSVFKKEMGKLCGDKFKSKANDERTASAFLACWNPQKYTFYMYELYKDYCNYLGEQPYETGEKYPHYLQLLPELIEIIKQDAELMNKFRYETNGLIQSDLLIAQNVLYQMKDIIKMELMTNIQGLVVRDSTEWKEDFIADLEQYGVIWRHQLSDMNEILPQLKQLVNNDGGFNFYNVSNNKTDYVFHVIDFATDKNYNEKKEKWKLKKPCWFCESFNDYHDDNKNAKIVFLVNRVERINADVAINIEDFTTYKNKQASRQNVVAYKNILSKIFQEEHDTNQPIHSNPNFKEKHHPPRCTRNGKNLQHSGFGIEHLWRNNTRISRRCYETL